MSLFHYFAYGSNMLTERLAARCPSAQPIGPAVAPDHSVQFSKPSVDGSSKAVIVASPGATAHGVLFQVAMTDAGNLDKAEGRSRGYLRKNGFPVKGPGGIQLAATTYVLDPGHETDLPPYDWYMALCIAGAHQHRLPDSVIDWLLAIPATHVAPGNERALDGERDARLALKAAGQSHLHPATS